jgi:ornithine carbamoyltransferase
MSDIRHFIDLSDFSGAQLRKILDHAKVIKASRDGMPKGSLDKDAPLSGESLAMIFEKSSTRTRISFDVGMRQLGGTTLVMQSGDLQLGRGETVPDTAKVLSRFVDVIMLRANDHNALLELAKYASVPVINALTNYSHPCQLMADILTIEEHLGQIDGKKIVWMGDGNNVVTSLIHAAVRFKFSLTLACPASLPPAAKVLAWAKREGGDITVLSSPQDATIGADVVVTDCWVSMGDTNVEERMATLAPFQVTQASMDAAADHAIFMHCLPAHRGEEVVSSVIDGHHSVVFDEAENRLHAQKAILAWCLGKI